MEVVAVNDHSPDGSAAILDAYAGNDSRLKVVHLPENGGLGYARNVGLTRATGDYVWFVDSDDVIPDGSIEAILTRLAEQQPDLLVIDHAEEYPDGRIEVRQTAAVAPDAEPPLSLADHPQLLRLAHSACTKLVRRHFLDEIGLRFTNGLYEDAVFSHHLLMAAKRIDILHRNCYLYRHQAGGSITTSVSARHFEVFDQYDRLFRLVEAAGGAYDMFRPELFRAMINHYLVILGNPHRLTPAMRKSFFQRMVDDYRRFLPPQGYPRLTGISGLKHRLVERDLYAAYASLRQAYRLRKATIPRQRGPKVTSPS